MLLLLRGARSWMLVLAGLFARIGWGAQSIAWMLIGRIVIGIDGPTWFVMNRARRGEFGENIEPAEAGAAVSSVREAFR